MAGLAWVCLVQVCTRAGGLAGLTQQVTSGMDAPPPACCQFQQGPQQWACPLPTLVQAGKRIEKVKPGSPEEVQRREETGWLL